VDVTTIMGLLNQISDEDVVLPAIQRDFVWSEEQTETLLDSIMRGYPIGIALLWETYNDIQYRLVEKNFRHGTLHTYSDNGDGRRLKVVLDGQQRLQSLYLALHGQRDGRSVYFDVLSGQRWDDLEQERYLFDFLTSKTAKTANDETLVSVGDRDVHETPIWWIAVRDLFAMPARARRDLSKQLTASLRLSDDDSLLLDENLGTFDETFTRDQN
jgi:hypothetical protein